MLEEHDFEQEADMLQESIQSLVDTNKEFIRIILLFTNRSDFKSKRIAMEIRKAFEEFRRAQLSLETLRILRGDLDN